MAVQSRRIGAIGAIQLDLRRLHESWMELLFPRQRDAAHSVLGKWTPSTTSGWAAYRSWAALGALLVALAYPMTLAGFALRFHTRRIDRVAAGLGVAGVMGLSVVVWGALTAISWFQFAYRGEEIVAVVAAAVVATLAAGAAVVFARVGGRAVTVALAYPSAMTALFLPPVVAALFSPTVGAVVLPGSDALAIWLLDEVLVYGGIEGYLRGHYSLEGVAYVAMWFAIAVPLGWLLGLLVALADVVRPRT